MALMVAALTAVGEPVGQQVQIGCGVPPRGRKSQRKYCKLGLLFASVDNLLCHKEITADLTLALNLDLLTGFKRTRRGSGRSYSFERVLIVV